MLWLQRLVSGQKARWSQDGVDLDLVYVTDNLVIMGLPASGLEAIYRNPRKHVRAFLERRHGRKWRLFNFCPVSENKYDSAYFYEQVSRFPFPDHHPPPLSLIPLFVAEITRFLDADSENVAVIHCKAGKGRSGTMTCCYLLSLPELPQAAAASESQTPAELPPSHDDGFDKDDASKLLRHLNEKAPHPALSRISTPETPAATSPIDSPTEADMDPADLEVADLGDKLAYIFQLHTKQRMKADSGKKGVSIPSQRRFVGYWNRVLSGDDPRNPLGPAAAPKQIKITSIDVTLVPGSAKLSFLVARQRISAGLATYRTDFAQRLRNWELAIKQGSEPADNYDWQDQQDLFQPLDFGFVEQQSSDTNDHEQSASIRHLVPLKHHEDATTLLEADQEIQIKLLVGKTGSKHSKLPDVASLGYIWIIPSFEAEASQGVWVFDSGEIDFLKPPVNRVEVRYEFV